MLGINKLLAFLRRSVGLRDDAASATGSALARLAQIVSDVTATRTQIGTSAHTRANNTVMGWLNSPIKSIQRGVSTYAVAALTITVTITSVTTSKAVVNHLGQRIESETSMGHALSTMTLTNATTLTITRGIQGIVATAAWEVIEYY